MSGQVFINMLGGVMENTPECGRVYFRTHFIGGAEAHLNTPGKLGGNWTWRAAEGFDAEPLASRIQAECEVYCRAKEPVEKEAKTSI